MKKLPHPENAAQSRESPGPPCSTTGYCT